MYRGRAALLVLAAGCAEERRAPAPDAPPTAHWMADVFADGTDVPIGRILLPGAFNATSYACAVENGISPDAPAAVLALWGTEPVGENQANRDRIVGWAKTQDRSVGQQLEDGIRFVEIVLTTKDGALVTWHSVYGVPLGDVLDELVAFSVAWPDEVVVVSFGLTVDSADWPLLGDALVAPRAQGASLCDRVWTGPDDVAVTALANVRASGRNLIWAPDGELLAYLESRGDCPVSRGVIDRVWSITDTPQGVEDALAASVDSRDPNHLLINDFVFSLDGAPSVGDQLEYILGYPGVREASQVLGFSGDFPGRLIDTWDSAGNLNIFAGAYYQDTDLVAAAIARNEAR